MANQWAHLFVGRDRELAGLVEAWQLAKAGTPQMAVLLGPPGMGKTRLVQEFYHHVAQTHDGAGDAGYWPDRLGRERDRFALSCLPGECNPANPMTMLWWAIKCVDSGSNHAASSDLLLAYNQFLKPHLDVRRTDEQLAALRKEQLKEAAKGVGEIGVAVAEKGAEAIPVIGPFIGLAKAVGTAIVGKSMRLRELEKQRSELESSRLDLAGKASAIQEDLEEQLMRALGNFARPPSDDLPVCPMIIVVDDAQFADQDPALRSFLRRFIDTAWAENWPVMVILTHWTYEWNLHAKDVEQLSGLIQTTVAHGLMQANVIPVGKNGELDQVLRSAIPDLPADQAAAILHKAGGNARYLDRLVQLLVSSPALFESGQPEGALHADAMDDILSESFDLHDVTRRLFDLASDDARRAAALANVQGERFLHELVSEVAEALGQEAPASGLDYCINPLSVIGDAGQGVGEFLQGVYREVARALVPRTVAREAKVREVLIALCRKRLDSWDEDHIRTHISPLKDLLLLDMILGLAVGDRDSPELAALIRRASLRKGALLVQQGDLAGARALFDPVEPEQLLAEITDRSITPVEALCHFDWQMLWGRHDTARQFALKLAPAAKALASELGIPDAWHGYAVAEGKLGDVELELDRLFTAFGHYVEYAEISRTMASEQGTAGARREHAVAENRLGDMELLLGNPETARGHYQLCAEITKALASELGTPDARREHGAAEGSLGDVTLALEGPAAARGHYQLCAEITRALANELGTPDDRRDHGLAEFRLGNVTLELDGPAAALDHYQRVAEIMQALASELGTPDARHGYAVAEGKLGDVALALEGPAAALDHYRRVAEIMQALASELGTPAARRDHAAAEGRLGDVTLALDGPAAARSHFERAVAQYRIVADVLKTPSSRSNLDLARERLFQCINPEGASESSDLTPGPRSKLNYMRERLADFIDLGRAMQTCGEFPSSRNAPCPCGSGKRYKHCHGANG